MQGRAFVGWARNPSQGVNQTRRLGGLCGVYSLFTASTEPKSHMHFQGDGLGAGGGGVFGGKRKALAVSTGGGDFAPLVTVDWKRTSVVEVLSHGRSSRLPFS